MRTFLLAVLSAVALLLAGAAAAAEAPASPAVPEAAAAAGERAGETPARPARKGRLRFRDGPVCICSDGLSERDIRDGAARQRGAAGITE